MHFFFFFKIRIFICLWLLWVFVAICRLSPVVANRGYSLVAMHGLLIAWLPLARSMSCGHRLSSGGTLAQLPCGGKDLPGPGIEPNPAVAGGFLTTEPPRKPPLQLFGRVLEGWLKDWTRKWQPTPAFLPGKFHGQRSLVSYSP